MLRLTALMTLLMFLTAGCDPELVASNEALFCDLEEPRIFTRKEVDWRAENAPENLRLDYKTNLTWERECAKEDR